MAENISHEHTKLLKDVQLYLGYWFQDKDTDSIARRNQANWYHQIGTIAIEELMDQLRDEHAAHLHLQLQVGEKAITRFMMSGRYYSDSVQLVEHGELEPGGALAFLTHSKGIMNDTNGLWLGDYGHYVHTAQIAEALTEGSTLAIATGLYPTDSSLSE